MFITSCPTSSAALLKEACAGRVSVSSNATVMSEGCRERGKSIISSAINSSKRNAKAEIDVFGKTSNLIAIQARNCGMSITHWMN